MSANHGFVATIIGGITITAAIYVLLGHASAVQTLASGASTQYGKLAGVFAGK